ncbi:probable E3 ubiquitin-protein ligase HIP1 [Salvia hispanica]|uniref:probable E3 ubiquitin-protein ligase HIP1 n=1 Tax=Salvia hispanica TaxID=49212 RepID=UPI002009C110|nr:probable E3 ubiquitin-protein ligase HIP1 [Salvia hispanica]
MDRTSGKRGVGGSVAPRKSYSGTAFKEAAAQGDQSSQFCNRTGCSGRVKFGQNAGTGVSDTSKYSKSSFRSSSGNEVTGKTNAKRSYLDSKRKVTQVTSDPSETSLSTETETQEIVSTRSSLRGYQPEPIAKSKEVNMTEPGSSSASTSVGSQNMFRSKSRLRNRSNSPASSVPSTSRSSAQGPFNRTNGSRYGLQNLRCNSISDAIPPSCSQPESASVRKNFIKKRSSEGETSSSSRGRNNTASSNADMHTSPTTSGISVSDSAHSASASVEDSSGSSSTWNRRSMHVNARMRFSSRQEGRNGSSVREPAASFSRNDYETPFDVGDGNTSQQFSVSGSRSHRDNSSSRTSFASAESGLSHLLNHDVLHRFNMDGIAEVLMALERIEQDEDWTDEQILALETRLFLSSLNLYDQHRDMRLDIDNMSYEELLALEERMGTVSTALSEEALSKCLTRSVYEATTSKVESTESADDIKCSICQDEYVPGDEIGTLVECQHGYHETCINQWLQVKNWCPICKASAAQSQPSPSL